MPPGAAGAGPGAMPGGGGGGGSTAAIVEVNRANFEQLVIRASMEDPPVGGAVIIDAYADWCGPCKQLTPKLERLVTASGGAVRLAKLNVDVEQELAQSLQITQLPTVLLVHKGKLVDSFTGAVPDQQLAQFVTKAVQLAGGAASGERALDEAGAAFEAGDYARAEGLYHALTRLPEHAAEATAGLAMCALRAGDHATAKTLVARLHESHKDALDRPRVRQAIAQLELVADVEGAEGVAEGGGLDELRAAVAADDGAPEPKFALAQALVARGEPAEAIELCLAILRAERGWNEGAAKEFLFKIFDSLGGGARADEEGPAPSRQPPLQQATGAGWRLATGGAAREAESSRPIARAQPHRSIKALSEVRGGALAALGHLPTLRLDEARPHHAIDDGQLS
eukprot:CAMPEP_0119418244 /NCGR_PEP_ID=MMETSP1335-20130426/17752_1 /TAXON_ID=259385 /ORGANISM="Chrysoculter rhomboideus, Strain RCC1486" /LENGTH=396 /DNA_ID=CAMNT_0007443473 /DNA_START=41 /DNA_END=1228 /DNA_ORIENTATION=-